MKLEQIIRNRKGTAGSGGAWRCEPACDSDPYRGNEYELWHYSTLMLKWRESHRFGVEILDYSTGHGSVSDQNGMNIAFRVLGTTYYFSRKGGAEIVNTQEEIAA